MTPDTSAEIPPSLMTYRPLVYDPYDPGDEWPDDTPGLMRVHVIQERARRLCQANSRDELRAYLRALGESVGGTKHDLAFRIVNRPQRRTA